MLDSIFETNERARKIIRPVCLDMFAQMLVAEGGWLQQMTANSLEANESNRTHVRLHIRDQPQKTGIR